MNVGWLGDKGQGKSYLLAKRLVKILKRNKHFHEKLKLPIRKVAIMETLGLAEDFKQQWEKYLIYFNELSEISKLKECDVFVDDISMRLDSRNWDLLPQATREWLYGSERLGCDFYFTAQKFSRVEITFRLLTDAVYVCTKGIGSRRPSATRPKVNRIWGLIFACPVAKSEFQAESFNQDQYGGGKVYWLSKKFTDVYDHTNISLSAGYADMQCIIRWCKDEDCPKSPHQVIKHV